jgi:cobalt/nickel transport system permease protein
MGHFHRAGAAIDHLERLGRGDSPVHKLHPQTKLLATAAYIALVASVPNSESARAVPFCLYPALLMPLSGTPWRPLIRRLAVALPFALAIGITNILLMRETVIPAGGGIPITAGMISCFTILLKTALCVLAALILIATTPFTNIAATLTTSAALRPLTLQIVLSYRYITTLLDEANTAWTAYTLRAPGAKAIRLHDMGSFLGNLLLRSISRAERVYDAMKSRGFTGTYHPATPVTFDLHNAIILALTLATLTTLRLSNISLALGRLIMSQK